jgi:transcriptional regulator with XRE-family HTH domain
MPQSSSPEGTQPMSSVSEDLNSLLDISPQQMAGSQAVHEAISGMRNAFLRARSVSRITQQSIALKLGVGRSIINRRLLGRENMTVRTLGELAWAMGYKLNISFTAADEHAGKRNWSPAAAKPAAADASSPEAFRASVSQRPLQSTVSQVN